MKSKIKMIQKKVGVKPDGIVGPQTVAAIMDALKIPDAAWAWPTQAEVRSGGSIFGAAGDESQLVSITPPYQLYYDGKPVRTIRVHRLIAACVHYALADVLEHYGAERIHALGLDRFSGCYNYRQTRGGKSTSMHAWGVALDWYAEGNGLELHAPAATLSHEDCEAWWNIWESYGAVSMGRHADRDWMHLQFARF